MLSLQLEEPGRSEVGVREGATFGIRALARGIDSVVHFLVGLGVGIFAVVLVAVSGAIRGVPAEEELARLSVTTPWGYLAAFLGSVAMHTLAEGVHGSTLGKRLCGLTVVAADGGHAGLLAALKRSVAFFWDALFFGLVAYHKMSDSPRRQRYGDDWAGTQVVRISELDSSQRRSFGRFFVAVAAALTVDGLVVFIEVASRLA